MGPCWIKVTNYNKSQRMVNFIEYFIINKLDVIFLLI